jgi:hypothetical protein
MRQVPGARAHLQVGEVRFQVWQLPARPRGEQRGKARGRVGRQRGCREAAQHLLAASFLSKCLAPQHTQIHRNALRIFLPFIFFFDNLNVQCILPKCTAMTSLLCCASQAHAFQQRPKEPLSLCTFPFTASILHALEPGKLCAA